MNFIIAQALGIIITIICLISPHFKRKDYIMLFSTIANLLYLLVYYLLEQNSGVAMFMVATVRTFVFYLFAKKEQKAPFWVMLGFVLILVISTVITWDGWVCIFILISAVNTYGQWQDNLKVVRISLVITTLSIGTYNILVMAYTGAINEFLLTISASIALWRYRKKSNESISK